MYLLARGWAANAAEGWRLKRSYDSGGSAENEFVQRADECFEESVGAAGSAEDDAVPWTSGYEEEFR
jgi:hypothetical protein